MCSTVLLHSTLVRLRELSKERDQLFKSASAALRKPAVLSVPFRVRLSGSQVEKSLQSCALKENETKRQHDPHRRAHDEAAFSQLPASDALAARATLVSLITRNAGQVVLLRAWIYHGELRHILGVG